MNQFDLDHPIETDSKLPIESVEPEEIAKDEHSQQSWARTAAQESIDPEFAPYSIGLINATVWSSTFIEEMDVWIGDIESVDGFTDTIYSLVKSDKSKKVLGG